MESVVCTPQVTTVQQLQLSHTTVRYQNKFMLNPLHRQKQQPRAGFTLCCGCS